MPAGRPRIFKSPEEMQKKIDAYFAGCDSATKIAILKDEKGAQHTEGVPAPRRYTVSGLSYFLGFETRFGPAQYAEQYPEFSNTINRARLRIESQRVEDGADPDTRNSNGIKFDLANNFNYKDLQQIEIVGELKRTTEAMAQIIVQYVPEDKRSEALGKLQSSVDF